MAKFRRFLIPHTPIIILFSAVWSDEGWMLVLSSSSIFILASFFGSKIFQNWKPSCVKWHLICPKQRRRELVHLSHLLLYILSLQRVKSRVVLTYIWAENPAQKMYLVIPLFTWALSQTWTVIHIQKGNSCWRQDPFLCNPAFFFFFLLNKQGITPHFLPIRISPILFFKGIFPVVAMIVLTISSAFLVLLPSLKICFLFPASQSLSLLY